MLDQHHRHDHANPYDETGAVTPYDTLDTGRQQNVFLYDTVAEGGESPNLFVAQEEYGQNWSTNPYPYPVPDGSYYAQAATPNPPKVDDLSPAAVAGQTLQANAPYSPINLGTSGFYPNIGTLRSSSGGASSTPTYSTSASTWCGRT